MTEQSSPFWVYILQNEQGQFYVGSASDLSARIAHHNMIPDDHPGWTQKHGPWRLVWQEGHPDCRAAALGAERHWRGRWRFEPPGGRRRSTLVQCKGDLTHQPRRVGHESLVQA
ncbi:MAG: GIY-YIG nuclease family protein [Phycisphaerae bacterium]